MLGPVETHIEHTALDSDLEDNESVTGVYVSIITPDGMRYSGHIASYGVASTETLAGMVIQAGVGAGAIHSPALGALLQRLTATPD